MSDLDKCNAELAASRLISYNRVVNPRSLISGQQRLIANSSEIDREASRGSRRHERFARIL
jgi:hypothetical protein